MELDQLPIFQLIEFARNNLAIAIPARAMMFASTPVAFIVTKAASTASGRTAEMRSELRDAGAGARPLAPGDALRSGDTVRTGADVTIIANGVMVTRALEAAAALAGDV